MDGHLVAVEIGVVRRADQRMEVDRLPLDEDGLERLNPEAMQRRRAIQQYRVFADHLVENVPDLGAYPFDHPLRALDVVRLTAVDELLHHERLEKLERHFFRK